MAENQSKSEGPDYSAINQLVLEITKCEAAGIYLAALALCYIAIDTMAFLSMPKGQENTTKKDFIVWVDQYLKGHSDQPYEYRGADVYAARCAVLHTWGAEASDHRKDSSIKLFGYTTGGRHLINPDHSTRLVLIGLVSFIDDVPKAISSFMKYAIHNEELRSRLDARIEKVMSQSPINLNFGS